MGRYSEFDVRMKKYENVSKNTLMTKVPVAIRIDGKAFHTFTKGFNRPFDKLLIKSMQETMKYLCENIQGCVLGYTQSDEITLILTDYSKLETSAWFDYKVQKLCSISASMATMKFNQYFYEQAMNIFCDFENGNIPRFEEGYYTDKNIMELANVDDGVKLKYFENCGKALFDSRCFNIPKEEVVNLIYWRQQDAIRNSIQMVGCANFNHKELKYKSCNDIQNMLFTEKGINWNDIPTHLKRGSCCIKTKNGWIVDNNIPIFKNEGREYIEKLI